MSQYGYGSGGYLTRFEDYYKSSSDESEDEDDSVSKIVKPLTAPPPKPIESSQVFLNPEQQYSDSEDEDYEDPFDQRKVFEPNQKPNVSEPRSQSMFEQQRQNVLEQQQQNGFRQQQPNMFEQQIQTEEQQNVIEQHTENHDDNQEEAAPPSKDWVPHSLNDLKMTIKPPKNFKGYQEGAYPEEADEQQDEEDANKNFSNDYADVCKFRCSLCGLDIDTEKLRSHINTNHESEECRDTDLDSSRPYSVKNYHKCGICSKTLLFTRVRLRYHIINDHNIPIQDYNDQFMVKRGGRAQRFRRGSGNGGADGADGGECDVDPSTVKEEDISNDYADIVKIDCKICNKHVEKDNFRFLHLKKHGMDMADYKVVYGEPVAVRNMYHRCHICQTIFVFTRSRLAGHLSRHKISVRDYGKRYLTKVKTDRNFTSNLTVGEIDTDCMFSNDYEDECQTVCKICDRSLNYGNLGSHLYQSHSNRMKDYVEQYGEPEITKKSYHECAICHETLLFIRYHLLTHVKTKHNMTISAYNKAHMQLHNVEYGDSNIMDKGRKIGTQKAPQWCDGTMYKCPYCFNIYYRYFTFRIHLINSHKMTDTEERSQCVKENEILTDIYRCKICSTQVKRDRMDIEAHLKQAHKTTLKIYSANFENPSVKENPQTIVSKLVRMGVLEEPSRSVCRTPKKLKAKPAEPKSDLDVPVNENLNKFVSVSENVAVENMEQVDIKTEMEETNFYNQRTASETDLENENDSALARKRKRKMPSKFNSDFEVTQVRSLKTVEGISSNKKPNSTVISSPLAQRSINTPHPVNIKKEFDGSKSSEEEGGVMYKCPLHPCSWTCGKDGMRQGPAVLHLLKVHKIQPLEMRERGIKFDKIQG